ncbi:MAG: ACP S-malonyltransferase [Candidatus Omnitrophota bacterium]|nr:ACP S-malonyltransferase [Candidatus Omnitrophota bacterium]
MVALIFPGQGAQYAGMGKDLYEAFKESKTVFDRADKILGFSLTKLCFEGPQEELTKTINCQPAILTASIAAFEAFKTAFSSQFSAVSYTAGLSLGEYSALVASGALSFEDGLRLVRKRAELMEETAKKHPGKMSAILGLGRKELEEICRNAFCEIANLNCPAQVVISGKVEAVDKAKEEALSKGAKRALDLEVSGAFHSSLMQEAAAGFAGFLKNFNLGPGSIPVISNVTARPQQNKEEITQNLIKQICSPVLWEDSIKFMAAQGVKTFYEIGPGNVLKGLIRKINPELNVINIGKKEDLM